MKKHKRTRIIKFINGGLLNSQETKLTAEIIETEKDIYAFFSGTKHWFDEDGYVHRDNDLPAVVYPDGSLDWRKHGRLHRDNGPARQMELLNMWMKDGVTHSEVGPAVIYKRDGFKIYCLNGLNYSKADWFEKLTSEQRIKLLFNTGDW